MNAIEIKNLRKSYTDFELNVSFSIPQGLCCGFVGTNGAGKTTTLKSMLGMVLKDSGEIRLLGKPDDNVTVKADIGVMFDQPYFQEDWTPLDVEKGIMPFYRCWNGSVYRKYLSRFELDPEKKFKNLSRGMKTKLAMAVNLSHDAKLLLLDEPTAGLDPAARDEILDIMRDYMVQDGRTILFSTHITSDLERIADMIVYISRGAISFCGEKDELTDKYCVVRGGKLPDVKRKDAIGLREHASGYECLMELESIGGLPTDTIMDRATVEDVVVYMERSSKNV
ncbi:MAG: ABC transporter ATP-binding protein [Clostridiales bacterium]|jgi:ABC-2 type transport system ATP-binding protein|nr:ABC transporter ATP-binding protein [Clostridiales bacterium]